MTTEPFPRNLAIDSHVVSNPVGGQVRLQDTARSCTNAPTLDRNSMSAQSSSQDQERLAASIALLKAQSKLEYRGEFGPEITTFIPFVAWLKQEGYLSGRRIVTYEGMRPYYFFLGESEFEGKIEPRSWLPESERYWPSNSTYTATASPWHVYPDYRLHFKHKGKRFDRPVLFIQNKFTVEWKEGPVNYIPLDSLRRILELTANKFDVVYSRPRQRATGYSWDDGTACDYPDRAVIPTLYQSPSAVGVTREYTVSTTAFAAEAAEEAPLALMIAAPRCWTVGMKIFFSQLSSEITEVTGLPPIFAL